MSDWSSTLESCLACSFFLGKPVGRRKTCAKFPDLHTDRLFYRVELGQVQGMKGSDLISLLPWVLARSVDILFLLSQSSLASLRPKEVGVH